MEQAVLEYVGEAIAEGRVHQVNLRDYITASEKLRIGVDWTMALERLFLPDAAEDLDSDEEQVRAFFLQSAKRELSARDLLMGPRRFRGHKALVDGLLAALVSKGTLIEFRPQVKTGQRGRPAASRYAMEAKIGSVNNIKLAV